MAEPRQTPYIWATWLTKLLVGERSCEWSAWFRAQHEGWSWQKLPSTFDLSKWTVEHTVLVNSKRSELESRGYSVFQEEQNRFSLRSAKSGIALGGKPDLIGVSGNRGLIAEAKTGQPRASDHIQVMVYMWAVPRALQQYAGVTFEGEVVFNDHTELIPAAAVDDGFINNVGELIRRLGSPIPARKVPSQHECSFCPITTLDCDQRAAGDVAIEGMTEDF